jgi:hypothetical protein
MRSIWALVAVSLVLVAGRTLAQERVALVIGNNNYIAATKLENALNDARAVKDRLEGLRFQVIYREDASRTQIFEALREFQAKLKGADASVVFFAGHGIQHAGQNYLLPVDAAMADASDADHAAIGLSSILQRLVSGGAAHNFIFLDACRNNPFPTKFNAPSGLATVDVLPNNTRLVFATEAGKAAYDAVKPGSRHGAFTFNILKWIGEPNLEAAQMLQNIQIGVQEDTASTPQGQQKPYVNSNVGRRFFFRPGDGTTVAAAPTAASFDQRATVDKQAEIAMWKTIQDTGYTPDMLRLYLKEYPGGTYASAARTLLAKKDSPAGSPAVPKQLAAADPAPLTRTAPATVQGVAQGAVPPMPAPAAAAPSPSPPSVQLASAPAASGQLPTPPKLPVIKDEMLNYTDPAGGWSYVGMARTVDKEASKFHGQGTFKSKDFQYSGEWKEGKKHGQGEMIWADGSRYKGKFVDDELVDRDGQYRLVDGSDYQGEVRAGKLTGQGRMKFKDGGVFEGAFLEGKPHGVGLFRFADGATYEGEMRHGRQHGKSGKFSKANGDRYLGEFADGLPHGRGKWVFAANGHEYEGDIRMGEMSGQGTYRYGASGMSYTGAVTNAVPNGQGVLYFADGGRFEGEFKGGTANAKGVMIDKEGNRKPTEIIDGQYRVN